MIRRQIAINFLPADGRRAVRAGGLLQEWTDTILRYCKIRDQHRQATLGRDNVYVYDITDTEYGFCGIAEIFWGFGHERQARRIRR